MSRKKQCYGHQTSGLAGLPTDLPEQLMQMTNTLQYITPPSVGCSCEVPVDGWEIP